MTVVEIMTNFPPALIFLAGAIIIPILPRRLRSLVFVLIPIITFLFLIELNTGVTSRLSFLNLELAPLRVDRLSLAFGYVFCLISFFGGIYAFHLKKLGEQVAVLIYAGSALGAIFAGDLFTLFIFWELMLVGSAWLVWSPANNRSSRAGLRYIIVHLTGGSFLLAGILLQYSQTGSINFNSLESPSSYLILVGFAVNAAIPPLHAWLPDAYPEASVTGSVFLSAFTTKVAVYALIRGFEGLDVLMWAGAVMAIYGAVFAFLDNDIRRILAYHIVSQVGFMVAAVGMGGHLAINGAVAHAFSHILYKGLLFMGTGVVLYATGKRKLTETGGLYKKMPAVFWLYMIGAVSISGFPLFSGFVSKGMVTYAAESAHHIPVFIMLLLASVGTFLHTGLKLPYFIWFGEKKDLAVKSIPKGMYVGMGLTALSCAVIGLYPRILYDILPYGVHYQPYTVSHLWETVCILVFTALVFWLMIDRVKPKEGITLDFDWFYRRPGPIFYKIFVMVPSQFFGRVNNLAKELVYNISAISANPVGNLLWNTRKVRNLIWNQPVPDKEPANYDPNRYRNSIGAMVLLIMIAFIVFIIVSLLS